MKLERSRLLTAFMIIGLLLTGCSSQSSSSSTTEQVTTEAVDSSPPEVTSTTTPDSTTTTTNSTATPQDELSIEIIFPPSLSRHATTVSGSGGSLLAVVDFGARVESAEANPITVEWTSDVDGFLGEGMLISAELSNGNGDVSSHQVTATATSPDGIQASDTVEIIVTVPSN